MVTEVDFSRETYTQFNLRPSSHALENLHPQLHQLFLEMVAMKIKAMMKQTVNLTISSSN
jgi:hypothetical protein